MMFCAQHTKAQKKPFVQWASVPKNNTLENTVGWLKLAMQGKNIDGAVVHANAGNYRSVWGPYYDQILAATPDRFRAGYATGNEQNFGIASNGASESDRFIAPGTPIVEFRTATGQWSTIVKWGSNGCLNPTPVVNDYAYNGDPDLYDGPTTPSKPPATPPLQNQNPGNGGNTNTITINPSGSQEHAWWVNGHNEGRNERERDLLIDVMVFKEIQDSKDCNSCGTSGSSGSFSTASFQVAQAPTTFQQMPSSQQSTYVTEVQSNKPNWTDVAGVVLQAANTTFNGINTFRGVRIEGVRNQRYQTRSSGWGYSNNWSQGNNYRDFQDNNQLGGNNFSTGYSGSGNNWNNTGGGNTWPW